MTYKVKEVVFNPTPLTTSLIDYRLFTLETHSVYIKWQTEVDEEVLKGLKYPEAELLVEYLLLNKRLGQLAVGQNAWLKLVRNGKMHGQVNTNGCATPAVRTPDQTRVKFRVYAIR